MVDLSRPQGSERVKSSNIAIIGAGIGGLAASIALRRAGFGTTIYEQAGEFRRIGAAINLTPNAVKVIDGLGVGEPVRDLSWRPAFRSSRTWDTGAETSRIEMGRSAEQRYGAPQLTMHRADLLGALEAATPGESIRFAKRLTGLQVRGDRIELTFSDGEELVADAVIGADGIHSVVREHLFGAEAPHYAGMVAFRSIMPAPRDPGSDLSGFTKWWGPTQRSQLVTFLISRGREFFVFATIDTPEPRRESWSARGTVEELRAGFEGYHPEARDIVFGCREILKTALYERLPMTRWSNGAVTLLGDACHPMMPFMAQGAAMALEDAAVLCRCMKEAHDFTTAFARYESARIPRASRVQLGSHQNDWLRTGFDPGWVYGYDAWERAVV